MNTKIYYNKLLYWIAESQRLIDEQSVNEIKNFVLSNQKLDGGFSDRSGKSDLYYSFFANSILQAFGLKDYHVGLRNFLRTRNNSDLNLVDHCSLAIIGKNLDFSVIWRWNRLWALYKEFRTGNYLGESSYQLFLLLLVFDYYGFNNSILRGVVKQFISNNKLEEEIPCSVLAAHLVFNQALGIDDKSIYDLNQYFDSQEGFKVFSNSSSGDLLSTAVSLVALKLVDEDVSVYAPSCLQLVDNNYKKGAFLSGDGDQTQDIEYTFYGLLILGILA